MNSAASQNEFQKKLYYFGILVGTGEEASPQTYHDMEKFILDASRSASTSREWEGLLCWLKIYGHILSPSKLRKLIKEHYPYQPAVLGGMLDFTKKKSAQKCDFKILKPYLKKNKAPVALIEGPRVRQPEAIFAKRGLLIPDFLLDEKKFLMPQEQLLKQCPEIRFRLLFGYSVNADVASALLKDPTLNAYRATLVTGNHKARVFAVFRDVKAGLGF